MPLYDVWTLFLYCKKIIPGNVSPGYRQYFIQFFNFVSYRLVCHSHQNRLICPSSSSCKGTDSSFDIERETFSSISGELELLLVS